jgi:hypothetical protein
MIGLITAQWQRFAVYGVIVLLACALLELDGYRRGERKLWDYQAKQATEAVHIVTKRGEVTERVITKYENVAGETKVVTKNIEKEVVRYVQTHPGAACLDDDWRRLHDAAADNLPDATGGPDGAVRAPGADTGSDGDDGFQRTDYGDGELRAAPPLR